MAPQFPLPGDVFEGRYRIEKVLGEGGFARVYLAQQTNLDRRVAVKILAPGGVRQTTWAARFEREAKVISKFKNPNTVMMYDFGATEDGLTYMVMEYIEGRELNQILRERGTFSASEAVSVLKQILASLREAHALGVVHRDIKPQNLLLYEHLGSTNQVKVLDFGIASLIDPGTNGENQLTADQNVVGTPSYMAPEQVTAKGVVPASDLYSTGLVMYEMLTGMRAYDGENTVATMAMHISEAPLLLPESLNLPTCLRSIVETMLEKPLEYRYASADQVLRDLEHWKTNNVPTKVVSKPLQHRTLTLSNRFASQTEPPEVKSQVRLIAVLIASIVSIAILVALLIQSMENMSKPDPVAAAENPEEMVKPELPVEKKDEKREEETAVAENEVVEELEDLVPEPAPEPEETVEVEEPEESVEAASSVKKKTASSKKTKPSKVEEKAKEKTEAEEKPEATTAQVEKKEVEKPVEKKAEVEKPVEKPVVKEEPAKTVTKKKETKKKVTKKKVTKKKPAKKETKKKVEVPVTF